MVVARVNLWSFLFILISIFSISTSDGADCEYTIKVQTGTVRFAGTDSTISLSLYDAYDGSMTVNNLVGWGGQMGPDHDYFENGNLDIFMGEARCLAGPICALKLTSDNSGWGSGWYVSYVEVSGTNSSCGSRKVNTPGVQKVKTTGVLNGCKRSRKFFTINQWLATDESPYSLTAIRDYCSSKRNLNVKGSDLNVEDSSDNKKDLKVERSSDKKKDLNVEGSNPSNVPGV